MNPGLLKVLLALAPILLLLLATAALYVRTKAAAALVQALGAACLLVVVLTHGAEGLHLLPTLNWGDEHSAGHYLDLSSAILGLTLFPMGFLLRVRAKRAPGASA